MTDDFEIKASTISGKGLFSKRKFLKGEVVLYWDISTRLSSNDIKSLSENEKKYLHPHPDGSIIVIQPPARYVNHSCNYNTEVHNFRDIAVKDIAVGEEITSNYLTDGAEQKFKCLCGSPNCCGFI